MIIFGTRERQLGTAALTSHSCGYCESRNTVLAQASTMYFHIFWVPVFPFSKKVYSVCTHCKQSLSKHQMPPDLNTAAVQAAQTLKAPWYYYTGLLLLAAALLLPTMAAIIATISTYF